MEEENIRTSVYIFILRKKESNQLYSYLKHKYWHPLGPDERQMCVLHGLNTSSVTGGCHSLEGSTLLVNFELLQFLCIWFCGFINNDLVLTKLTSTAWARSFKGLLQRNHRLKILGKHACINQEKAELTCPQVLRQDLYQPHYE